MRGGGGRLGRGMEEWRKEEGGEASEKARSYEEMGERKRGGVQRERWGGQTEREVRKSGREMVTAWQKNKEKFLFFLGHHVWNSHQNHVSLRENVWTAVRVPTISTFTTFQQHSDSIPDLRRVVWTACNGWIFFPIQAFVPTLHLLNKPCGICWSGFGRR